MNSALWVKELGEIIKPTHPTFPWLEKPYILTQALKRVCQACEVNLIEQSFAATVYSDEQALLSLEPNEATWVRQVFLQGDQVPWVYARVVIPATTYAHYQQDFANLGTKPLGETLLYQQKNVKRGLFEYAYLPNQYPLFKKIFSYLPSVTPAQALWGRRSLFWLNHDPLLVTEFFLPDLPPYVD